MNWSYLIFLKSSSSLLIWTRFLPFVPQEALPESNDFLDFWLLQAWFYQEEAPACQRRQENQVRVRIPSPLGDRLKVMVSFHQAFALLQANFSLRLSDCGFYYLLSFELLHSKALSFLTLSVVVSLWFLYPLPVLLKIVPLWINTLRLSYFECWDSDCYSVHSVVLLWHDFFCFLPCSKKTIWKFIWYLFYCF